MGKCILTGNLKGIGEKQEQKKQEQKKQEQKKENELQLLNGKTSVNFNRK